MALRVFREFLGKFQEVGLFEGDNAADRSAWMFRYSPDYLASSDAHPISYSLPLREEAYEREEYQGFFEGMAPEGQTRTELAHRFHIAPSDYLGLLERLGSECIGAIHFLSDGAPEIDTTPRYTQLSRPQLDALCDETVPKAAEELSSTKLSLAGAQSKIGIYVNPKAGCENEPAALQTWFEPSGTAASTHILKIADSDSRTLAANELACMELARTCEIEAADSAVIDGFDQLFLSRRFDRPFPDEGNGAAVDGLEMPWRLHQEDFCQALGWPSYLKYEIEDTVCYALVIGNIIAKVSADVIGDRRKFARITLFNYFIGNCDNHLKNHSFLYSPSWDAAKLAPLYDAVCTTMLGFDRKMGFCIGDHQIIDDITFEDWELFGEDLSLGKGVIKRLYGEMLEQVTEGIETTCLKIPSQAASQLERIAEDMRPRLKSWHR